VEKDAIEGEFRTANPDTWLVIPLYNEEQVIATVIADALRTFDKIVCVNDGSTDGSARQARSAGAVVVDHPVNLGQGAALQTGIEYACTDPEMRFVVTFDADGQHRPYDAAHMVEILRQGEVDIVFGSRFLDGRTQVSAIKRAVLKVATTYTNRVTRVYLTDAHNGLRAFTRAVAERMDLKQNRMAHASEIVSFVAAEGFRYREAPVEIFYTDYSKSKGQSLLNSVNIITEMIFR
jgi:glycosyltransferase involved in cell wall biosynthesis